MRRRPRNTASHKGFTLTELTVVLIIVALLLGGLLMPLSAQRDTQNLNKTRRLLEQARESLLGFAAIYGRLPCPANPAIATGTAGAGIEYPPDDTGCTVAREGALPWGTLGLPETDAWDRRFTYRVAAAFARRVPAGQNAAFALNDNGDIDVFAVAGGATLVQRAPAIITSHGTNGRGAYLPSGAQLALSPDADEQENADADNVFVGATATPTFDDLLAWISPSILMNRMISAGRLP